MVVVCNYKDKCGVKNCEHCHSHENTDESCNRLGYCAYSKENNVICISILKEERKLKLSIIKNRL